MSKILSDILITAVLLGFFSNFAGCLSKSILACQKAFLTGGGGKQLVKKVSKTLSDKQKSPFLLGFLQKTERALSKSCWSLSNSSPPRSGGDYYLTTQRRRASHGQHEQA
jgi:hypothetical protein